MPPEHHAKSEQVDRQSCGENTTQAEPSWGHWREVQSVSCRWHTDQYYSGAETSELSIFDLPVAVMAGVLRQEYEYEYEYEYEEITSRIRSQTEI